MSQWKSTNWTGGQFGDALTESDDDDEEDLWQDRHRKTSSSHAA